MTVYHIYTRVLHDVFRRLICYKYKIHTTLRLGNETGPRSQVCFLNHVTTELFILFLKQTGVKPAKTCSKDSLQTTSTQILLNI